jgi:hypothetical protein
VIAGSLMQTRPAAMDAPLLDEVLQKIFQAFSIIYADFDREEYQAYRERRIGGFVRFDERRIFFDRSLPREEEDRTWAHEILSIYYYWLRGIIRHDNEVEREARHLCKDEGCLAILRRYQGMARERDQRERV